MPQPPWARPAPLSASDSQRFSLPSVLLPALIALVVQVPFAAWQFTAQSRLGEESSAALNLGAAVAGPAALLLARRWPGPVVAFCALVAAADLLVGSVGDGAGTPGGTPPAALAFALVSAVVRGARAWAFVSVAAAWVLVLLVGLAGHASWGPIRVVAATLGVLLVIGLGEAIRTRRERSAAYRKETLERRLTAEQAERVRIARDLHDVLAHSLSSINVQAGVGLHLIGSRPEQAAEALGAIKNASKLALDEVRTVLGVLRADAPGAAPLRPAPDLSRLHELAQSARAGGIEVTVNNTLAEPPPVALQQAGYRIVQEALTNVVRHSAAKHATVDLFSRDGDIVIRIQDDGTGPDGEAPPLGRGILGMQERAELLGGSLTARRTADGFSVEARLPRDAA